MSQCIKNCCAVAETRASNLAEMCSTPEVSAATLQPGVDTLFAYTHNAGCPDGNGCNALLAAFAKKRGFEVAHRTAGKEGAAEWVGKCNLIQADHKEPSPCIDVVKDLLESPGEGRVLGVWADISPKEPSHPAELVEDSSELMEDSPSNTSEG